VDWYYAIGGERFGPFDQEAFDQLVSQGKITGVTLVWRDGLDDWVQYQFLAGPSTASPGDIPPVMVQCTQCHRQASQDDMVQYQDHWVCAECKDTFYQRVREGGFSPQSPAHARGLRFAGFWIRVGASILDGLILLVVNSVFSFMLQAVITSTSDHTTILWMQLLVSLIQLAIGVTYVTWFLGRFGATPGKMACGLKVIVSNGRPITYLRAFGRYWAVALSLMITYILFAVVVGVAVFFSLEGGGASGGGALIAVAVIIGIALGLLGFFPFYMAGMTKQKCALHDFICNTRVIRAR
jgi:uncharacterized RDD family membrane protein YckC